MPMMRTFVQRSRPDYWVPPYGYDYDWLLVDNASRLIDWSLAGAWYGGVKGIPTYPVGITVNTDTPSHQYYCDPTGSVDCTAKLQAAINACPAGHAVLMPAGTYRSTSGNLSMKNGVVLRGSGIWTTLITCYGTASLITMTGGSSRITTDITAGYGKGSTAISVTSASGLVAGDLVFIDQENDPALVSMHGTDGDCNWCGDVSATRSYGEMNTIVSIAGNVITLDKPLKYDFKISYTPRITRQATISAKKLNCGVEAISLAYTNGISGGSGKGLITMNRAEYCWLDQVEMYNCPHQDTVSLQYCKGIESRGCYLHDTAAGQSIGGYGYGFDMYEWTTDCLIEDNIVVRIGHPLLLGSMGSTGNVIAYNVLLADIFDSNNEWWIKPTGTHGCHTYMNLWEGNYTDKIGFDDTWGSGSHNVTFRNHITGDTVLSQYLDVIEICAKNYYNSFIGNILGCAAMVARGWQYQIDPLTNLNNKDLFRVGYPAGSPGTVDANVAATMIRHGNYDYIHAALVWEGGIGSHDIPDSLYLAAKPSWWDASAWPPFTPERVGFNPAALNVIPAKTRYDAL